MREFRRTIFSSLTARRVVEGPESAGVSAGAASYPMREKRFNLCSRNSQVRWLWQAIFSNQMDIPKHHGFGQVVDFIETEFSGQDGS
jgi:hypothetical protein